MARKLPERKGTKSYMIRELADRGLTKRQCYAELRSLVESQVHPMIFTRNPNRELGETHRMPKESIAEQLIDLKNEIGRVYALLGRSVSSDFESDEIEISNTEVTTETETESESEIEKEEKKPRAAGKTRLEDQFKFFLSEVRRIRAFCVKREQDEDAIDSISMRPVEAGSKLLMAGIPVRALLFAMTMHWPKDVRRDAEIQDFDFKALSQSILKERGITTVTRAKDDGSGTFEEPPHYLLGYAIVLAECRQPIMLIGPMGTGKSHLAEQLGAYFGCEYGETPMSPGATRGDLLGRHTIGGLDQVIAAAALGDVEILKSIAAGEGSGGFISAEFCERYGGGGIFNFEEFDASDPSMIIVLNNALAGKKLFNSVTGERIRKSLDFIPICTANTMSLGANKDYTGRDRQDAAAVDRWRMGRIFVPLDEDVEEWILYRHLRNSENS